METVIAEYPDRRSAEFAVRSLERGGFSIQDFSVTDESRRVWRKLYPAWARRSSAQTVRRSFLLGGALTFVLAQLALYTALLPGTPTWLVLFGTCVLGGCLGGALGLRHALGKPQKPAGFYVVLRSDAATTEAVRAHVRAHGATS
jgi:hypothetical protein